MNLQRPFAEGLINRIIDAVPGYLDKAAEFWDELVQKFSSFLSDYTQNYDVIMNADKILMGLIALVVLVPAVTVFVLRRRSNKPQMMARPTTPREAKKAAKRAYKSGNFVRAGELYEQAEVYNKALDMYERGRAFGKMAGLYANQMHMPEKGIEILEKNKLWDPAARMMANMGRHAEAADYYFRSGKQQLAAEEYDKAGDMLKAGELYLKLNRNEDAARCFGRAKAWAQAARAQNVILVEFKKAIEGKSTPKDVAKFQDLAKKTAYFFKQAQDYGPAADILLSAKMPKLAAELYLLAGDEAKAAELFLEDLDYKRAAELFSKAGDRRRAAEIMAQYHQKQGNELETARYLVMAEDYLGAADIYAGQNEYEKAAQLFMKGGDSRAASEMFVLAGQTEKALQIFEKTGDLESAIRLCEEAGDDSALAGLYARTKRFFEAAALYQDKGLFDKAAEFLEKVSAEDPRFAEANYKLGQILMEKGDFPGALHKFQIMASRVPLSAHSLDHYYMLAMAYERNDELMYAMNLYQQIMAFNYHYKDVAMRVNGVAKKLAEHHGAAYNATRPGSGWGRPGGTIAERYKVVKELGRGGMGVVYMAEDTHLGRNVAFKVMAEEFKTNQQMVASFVSEARSLAKLNHPYIVSIIDAGEESGVYFIIMEFIEGKDFKQLMGKNKRLPVAAGVNVFMQLCQALDYAHGLKIIHRDIKPANIMWTSTQTIKIMDFGLAKVMDKMREGRTVVAGTPYYMSPEQTLGRNVDHRSDIYSMGVSVYELLTGSVPFMEGDIGYHHIHTPPTPPTHLNNQIPPELERIILKCMAKDQNQRYQSARETFEDLTRLQNQARS